MIVGSELSATTCPTTTPTSCAGCATPGFVIVGKTNCRSSGSCRSTEPRRFGPTRNPWDTDAHARRLVRRRGGGGRRRDGADRARQRRRRLDPHPGRLLRARRASSPAAAGSRAGPTWATRSSSCDGVLTRTVADTAALLDVLAGYEPGDATWAPPPAEPFSDGRRARPGPAAHRR